MSHKQIPGWYAQLQEKHPDLMGAVQALGKAARQAGPLDEKTAQLVQVAAAAAACSEGSVHSHVRRALEAGASPDEISHAIILLTSVIGFPHVSAALRWAADVIEETA